MMISIDPYLIRSMAANGKRIDGRSMDEYRKIEIERGVIETAEGSAQVRIGDTEVIAGIKIGVGEPFADTPDEGVMMVGTELVPLASPDFEAGPPGAEAVEVSRVVDRAIRESKCIDMKKLCIKPKEKVWIIFVDVDVLDDDGNLIDASSLAAIAALQDTRLPVLDEEYKIKEGELSDKKLPLKSSPVSVTIARIGDALVVDPALDEIKALDSRLTVGTYTEDGVVKLCSMQKGGERGLMLEEIEEIVSIAEKRGEDLRKKLG